MARKKLSPKRKVSKARDLVYSSESFSSAPQKPIFTKKFIILVVILVLIMVGAYLKRSWFVAALINGRPITRLALDKALVKQYGSQTLDNMINEDLINQQIADQHVTISQADIDQKVAEITAGLPQGVTLDQALQLQGMDTAEFKNQVRVQLGIDKILGSQINVTDKEIAQYIATNAAQFKTASPAAAQDSARNILVRQKENDGFTSWFSGVRQKAKITKFL